MREIAEWTALARQILKTGHDIFATANVPITAKGYNDEKFLAMALLARTMSNFRGALLLLEHRRVIEGRVITRCCLENSYWIAGLVAEGEKFTREMLHDEIGHRQIRGQRLFARGLPLGDKVEERLRAWLKNSSKRFKNAKTLTPKTVALKTAIGKSYIFYEQLSSDAAHPSLDALNRHVIPHTPNEVGGIDVEPVPRDEETAETLEYLCMAVMGVCVGVNEILGGTQGGDSLNALADQYTGLSNRLAARRTAPNKMPD
jgi:hypothetical protein